MSTLQEQLRGLALWHESRERHDTAEVMRRAAAALEQQGKDVLRLLDAVEELDRNRLSAFTINGHRQPEARRVPVDTLDNVCEAALRLREDHARTLPEGER